MNRVMKWTISLLVVAVLSVVGVQQLIKRLHYGSGKGVLLLGTNLGRRSGSRTWELSSRGIRRI